jgi:hypothetical protein
MARTNVRRGPDDNRPLPPGIRPIAHRRFKRRPKPTKAELRLARQADRRVVAGLSNMRGYEASYPAAVAVRERLGRAKWEKLERYRMGIVRVSAWMRRLDREQRVVPRARLEVYLPAMKRHIERVCGEYQLECFLQVHETLDELIAEHTCTLCDPMDPYGIGPDKEPMTDFKSWFHQRPVFWLLYSLHFPTAQTPGVSARGRMNWHQQMEWAIWTLQHPVADRQAVTESSPIWNRALVEVFQKILSAFRPQN